MDEQHAEFHRDLLIGETICDAFEKWAWGRFKTEHHATYDCLWSALNVTWLDGALEKVEDPYVIVNFWPNHATVEYCLEDDLGRRNPPATWDWETSSNISYADPNMFETLGEIIDAALEKIREASTSNSRLC